MNTADQSDALNGLPGGHAASAALTPAQWRQMGLITLAALVVFLGFRWLPTGTALSHMDFRVDAKNSIEFCDPLNPQFIPVVAVASPVALTIRANSARAGQPVEARVRLATSGGKPIATNDLLVVHTRRLHLLLVDPSLSDYQHVHPEPTDVPGEWALEFTPRTGGVYRIFADFTPAATGRGLYAMTDLEVESSQTSSQTQKTDTPSAEQTSVATNDHVFTLTALEQPLRARQTANLKFSVTRRGGGTVSLLPVMDAYAHLVAFDQSRSGFAHLHPMQSNPLQAPDGIRPELDFKVTIPTAGRYVVWAQVNLAGQETFVPFWFDVVE